MGAITLSTFLANKLKSCDLVLGKISRFENQCGIADVGRIYRTKFLFRHKYFALEHKQIEFVGGGNAWGEMPNYAGEIGFLFLCNLNGRIYQDSWHGHIPIVRHKDGLWCLFYGVKLWEFDDVPPFIRNNIKPNTSRLDGLGQSFDTWARFEVIEAYLIELISELDQKPCEPFELADSHSWLNVLPQQE